MPLALLIAIVLAFGVETSAATRPMEPWEAWWRVGLVLAALSALAVAAGTLGRLLAWVLAAGRDYDTAGPRHLYVWGARLVTILTLVIYGAILFGADWRHVVESGFGLRDAIVVDEFLVLAPFLLAQVVGWWGLYPAERVVRSRSALRAEEMGLFSYLARQARQSMGLVLPMAFVYALGQDLLRHYWPDHAEEPWVQVALLAAMGATILVAAPAFVRIAWPTRPLPDGPLRDRLLRLARRFRFRCTDILVWDTGGAIVNACVTGSTPWFRYVLLTDALIEHLDDREIEAVFGHEIGHIAHRHLHFFGLFILGSLGLMALLGDVVDRAFASWMPMFLTTQELHLVTIAQGVAVLAVIAVYILVVFGALSRRFERQADVFGCRVVSCGQPDCPPHADLNAVPGPRPGANALCPVGIRTFISALASVARLNGIARQARSWRHGSIERRISFLEQLESQPEAERQFQIRLVRLQLGLAVLLLSAMGLAIATGSLEALR